ncbi:hypothetical protein DXU84_04150 [Rahnella sp. RcJ3]|nr:hypothetical protein [Rahnella sp. RcJ3]
MSTITLHIILFIKIKVQITKIALHRTRLRFLQCIIFSVFIFYKPIRQTAPRLGFSSKSQTEKIEMNFSIFQF